ncbi:lipoprotein [Streptomyces marokkonensis]|uniref:Lipoprotein n=1 Tax=Streptomyces marokkonensis TaxID=324855 RepID=A0ABP7NVY4_9ACTN
MPHHKTALRLAAPVAVLVLALTACGGGDDTAAKGPASPEVSASPSRAASGGNLATGESATGKVVEGPGEVTYDVVAQKVEVGTEAEAARAVADAADAEGRVPAVAHVKYTHKGGPALTEGSDVHDGTTVFADGQRGGVLVGGAPGDAPGCEDPYDVRSWKQGESHVFCETYLIPADATSVEVQWEEEDGEPYVWKYPRK